MRVVEEVLPAYRSKFSKRTFTQPQLLAVLCLMRYEDWTFREAEVWLAEHVGLRAALGLTAVPDHPRYIASKHRLNGAVLDSILAKVVKRLSPRRGRCGKRTVAVDATGLAARAKSHLLCQLLTRPRRGA